MPQPTAREVHADRPLTNLSVAEMQRREDFIAGRVFPFVPSRFRSDQYYQFTREFFLRIQADRRAPGADAPRGGYGVTTASFECQRDALENVLPDPVVRNADAALNLPRSSAEWLMHQLMLRIENRFVTAFFGTSLWNADTTPGITWDDDASTPIEDVATRNRTMLTNTGYNANTFVSGVKVFDDLRNHADIVDRVKYTGGPANPAIIGEQALAALFRVGRFFVARVTNDTGAEGRALSPALLANTRNALLVYAAPRAGLMQPSAGYTFTWGGGRVGANRDNGIAAYRYREGDENLILGVEQWYSQVLVTAALGEFFSNAVAA